MEAINLLKFWRKTANSSNAAVAEVISAIGYVSNGGFANPETEYYYSDDDDDSFFELELNDSKNCNEKPAKLVESPRDVFSNGRVFPLDSTPQSPISLLKSGPKFKLFVVGFKKSKTETTGDSATSPKKCVENGQSKRLDGEETPVLSRDNSLRSKMLRESFDDFSGTNSPKKSDSLRSKLLKPLYSMASKRYNVDVVTFSDNSPMVSPLNSPSRRNSGFKNVCKNIRKTKSANSGMMASPVNRRDDCLLNDGIQGAILHCNSSYNSPAKGTTDEFDYVIQGRGSEVMNRSRI